MDELSNLKNAFVKDLMEEYETFKFLMETLDLTTATNVRDLNVVSSSLWKANFVLNEARLSGEIMPKAEPE